ncbi:ribonuclease H-like domain-containing protein [Lysobacter tyrosinilyticus]
MARTSIEQLRQLLRVRAPQRPLFERAHDREVPGRILAPGLHLVEAHLPDEPLPPAFCGAFDRRDALDPTRLLFFDTETTGLAGGTGTRAFMIGAADWQEGALRIRQLTITTTAAETAMLDAFRDWLTPDTVLVSYNGKCYDAPLLATRYRLARQTNPLAGLAHVDLLYPSRRRWRGVYENCRLATIERQVLRVVREDDLPGAEAPAAWLSYLRGGSAHTLRRVLAHNHQDVISLSRLLRRLSSDGHEADGSVGGRLA